MFSYSKDAKKFNVDKPFTKELDVSEAEKEVNKVIVGMEIEKYRNFFPLNFHENNKIQSFISFGVGDYVCVAFFSLMFSLIISGFYFSMNPFMDFIATGKEPLISIKVFIAMVCGFFALFAPILTFQTIFNSVWWRMRINPFNYSDENLAKIMSVFNVVYKNDYFTGTERYKEIAEIVNGRKS